jgi:tight adherence protein B
MTLEPMAIGVSLLIGTAFATIVMWVAEKKSAPTRLWRRYRCWWTGTLRRIDVNAPFHTVPIWQSVVFPTLFAAAIIFGRPIMLVFAAVALVLPPWLLVRYRVRHQEALDQGLAAFLTILADSLTTVPNLTEALNTVLDHVGQPFKNEVRSVLREVRIGNSLDDALTNMAGRVRLPGFDAAVGAALLGRRTGGDLPCIFRRIADTVREMARLEGVIRTKTAEGRCQAWVMGSVPPGLMVILEYIDPDWIAPLWTDPIGWAMIGLTAILEVSAIALIRKIMAVVI